MVSPAGNTSEGLFVRLTFFLHTSYWVDRYPKQCLQRASSRVHIFHNPISINECKMVSLNERQHISRETILQALYGRQGNGTCTGIGDNQLLCRHIICITCLAGMTIGFSSLIPSRPEVCMFSGKPNLISSRVCKQVKNLFRLAFEVCTISEASEFD